MELFTKTVNTWKPLTILKKISILDAWQSSEYTSSENNLFYYYWNDPKPDIEQNVNLTLLLYIHFWRWTNIFFNTLRNGIQKCVSVFCIYLFKVNDGNARSICEICSKLTIKTAARRQWRRSGIFIVNFEQTSHGISIVDFKQVNAGWVMAL